MKRAKHNKCLNYGIINCVPPELIISPSAMSLSPVLTNSLPLTLLNSSGTFKVNFNISFCSNMLSFVMFIETFTCEAPGVNTAISGSEAKSTPPPMAAAVKKSNDIVSKLYVHLD